MFFRDTRILLCLDYWCVVLRAWYNFNGTTSTFVDIHMMLRSVQSKTAWSFKVEFLSISFDWNLPFWPLIPKDIIQTQIYVYSLFLVS